MSVTKHYTEWSKEDKDALANQRMEAMRKKNEEINRRYAEVEADRKKAEQQNSSITLTIKSKSPPVDQGSKFFDDPARTRGSGYEGSHDVPRRNLYNSGSKDFRNSRQDAAPRKPHEKEFVRGSNMSEREREDYEKWKAEREAIDEERIARKKVLKREWDEHKVEQEPEFKSLPSKFCREPSWISKQDDRPQRRDFSQRGNYRGNDRAHFKNSRQNYESEEANWHKPNKSFGRSESKGSSFDKCGRASLSDDEDNRYSGRQQKVDNSNNYPVFRRNQDGTSNQNFAPRIRGGGFFQGSRSDSGKHNSASLPNHNNSYSKHMNNTGPNTFHSSGVHNSSDNCFNRNDGQFTNCKDRFQGSNTVSRLAKQSSGTWSSDEDTDSKTGTTVTVQKSDSSKTKQNSGNWSDDDDKSHCSSIKSLSKSKPKQNLGTWSDDDSTNVKTNAKTSAQRNNSSFPKSRKKTTGDTWSDDDNNSVNIETNSQPARKHNPVTPQAKQTSGTWSDDDFSNVETNTKMSAQRNSSSFSKSRKKATGGTWSDDDSNCVNIKTNSRPAQAKQTLATWSDDDDGTAVKQHSKLSSSTCSNDHVSSGGAWSDIDDGDDPAGKSRNDDAWLDISDKSANSNDVCEKTKRWAGKQAPTNFSGGRGRKWSYEPSHRFNSDTRNSSYYDNEKKSESRAITLGNNDSLTVTISSGSNDVKGSRPFSQWGARNSELYYRNAERTPQVLSRSYSDPDKHQVKHDEPDYMRRQDDCHGFQQNSRNFRGRGSGLKRGNFSNAGYQKNKSEVAPQQKVRDSSRGAARGSQGGFQHSNSFNRGARRSEETRRYTENHETQNRSSRSQKNEKSGESWCEAGKENVNVHSENNWGDVESSENAVLDQEWTGGNIGNSECLKSEVKKDGWETENCDGSTLQPNDANWKSEDCTPKQIKRKNQVDDKNNEGIKQNNPGVSRSLENEDVNTKQNVHEAESPVHECTGNESHDDSSWVSTSGDEFEELGGGYIDDNESLHISNVQHYDYGDDTSSPEPVHFVCSMSEFLNRGKTAQLNNVNDKTETEQVHGTEKLKDIVDNAFCSTPRSENFKTTQNELSDNRNVLSESKDVTENFPLADVAVSTTSDDQIFLSEDHADDSTDRQLSVADHCKISEQISVNDDYQNAMPEMQGHLQPAVHSPTPPDGSCETLYSQGTDLEHAGSTCENNGGQNISSDHYKDSDPSPSPETLCNSGVAHNFSSQGNLDQNCISVNFQNPGKSICNEVTSVNVDCSNTSEELSQRNEFQNSTVCGADKATNNMCITSSDSASCNDNSGFTEGNGFSEVTCDKHEDRNECEIDKHVVSSNEQGDKAEMESETAVSTQQTEATGNTAHSKIPLSSGEDLNFNESLPAEDSYATSDPAKDSV